MLQLQMQLSCSTKLTRQFVESNKAAFVCSATFACQGTQQQNLFCCSVTYLHNVRSKSCAPTKERTFFCRASTSCVTMCNEVTLQQNFVTTSCNKLCCSLASAVVPPPAELQLRCSTAAVRVTELQQKQNLFCCVHRWQQALLKLQLLQNLCCRQPAQAQSAAAEFAEAAGYSNAVLPTQQQQNKFCCAGAQQRSIASCSKQTCLFSA